MVLCFTILPTYFLLNDQNVGGQEYPFPPPHVMTLITIQIHCTLEKVRRSRGRCFKYLPRTLAILVYTSIPESFIFLA